MSAWALVWIGLVTVLALPAAIQALRGWSPPGWVSNRSPSTTRVAGLAMLLLWAAGVLYPVPLVTNGEADEVADFFVKPLVFGLAVFGVGLMAGSAPGERFWRKETERTACENTGPDPEGSQSRWG